MADTGNNRIQVFDSNGNFITKWGSLCHLSIGKGCVDPDGNGQFRDPEGVAVDTQGRVYVADTGNNRIQVFDAAGNFITKWGSACRLRTGEGCVDPDGDGPLGLGDGQCYNPCGVAVDAKGKVYVADTYNGRTQVFNSNGDFITKWVSVSSDVALDDKGHVYVAGGYRIQKFWGGQ